MKRLSLISVLLFCLVLPAGLLALENSRDEEELSELQITLNEYREEGYNWLGPVQYLGKTSEKIRLYRNKPVSYRILDTIDESGDISTIKKYDFVHVLSKQGHVVLIRLDREGENNA